MSGESLEEYEAGLVESICNIQLAKDGAAGVYAMTDGGFLPSCTRAAGLTRGVRRSGARAAG